MYSLRTPVDPGTAKCIRCTSVSKGICKFFNFRLGMMSMNYEYLFEIRILRRLLSAGSNAVYS